MINCCNPKYIVHPHTRQNILKHRNYTFLGQEHFLPLAAYIASPDSDLTSFWKAAPYLTETQLENSYVTNLTTGENYPIYLEVPCNHCVLCRKKKKEQLSFRAQAETNYWCAQGSPTPLFVTLTYNNNYVPYVPNTNKLTLRSSDITLFLKRLRQNLARRYGRDVSGKLRYILCGEYGKNTKRPHYHILFWNFPNLGSSDSTRNLVSCIHAIEDSWSTIVDWRKNPVTGVPEPVYESLGFISCYEATSGASGYIAKYIGKTCQFLDPAAEKPFIHRSCGALGGIGAPWLKQWILDNPGCDPLSYNSWTLTDPYTGCKVYSKTLPSYFVNKIVPPSSSYLTKEIRYALNSLDDTCTRLSLFSGYSSFSKKIEIDRIQPIYIPDDAQAVFDKYGFEPSGKLTNYNRGIQLSLNALISRYGFQKIKQYLWRVYDYLIRKLIDFSYDKSEVERNVNRRNSYYSRISPTVDTSKDMLNYLKYKAEKAERLAELREYF
uniref:Replication initiator protein n=1 Tax=Dulem virus 246 TaxID=3145723 RepID=A0AAU8BAK1_9VIRU